MQPDTAMIFAAGFGTRMGDLTKTMPKPLIPIRGKPMIDHTLEILANAGIKSVLVNTHYFADQLEKHLQPYQNIITIREEPKLLETGGGLKNALSLISGDPVFTATCDAIWLGENPIKMLTKHWQPDNMDGLLLLVKKPNAFGYSGSGDFSLSDDNRLQPKRARNDVPYIYSGLQIIKTELLETIEKDCFSMWLLWEKMLARNRLSGVTCDNKWIDVGHPEGIEIAEKMLNHV